MAITLSPLSNAVAGGQGALGGRRLWLGFVALDSSYPTGGYSVSPTLFGMALVTQVFAGVLLNGAGVAMYSQSAGGAGSLQIFTSTSGVEMTNGTNLTGVLVPVVVVGV